MAQVLRRRGRVQVRLNQDERNALTHIVDTLEPLVEMSPSSSPRAYEDAESQSDYAKWVHEDLAKGRNSDIRAMLAGLEAGEDTLVLTEEQAFGWLRALTHLRLAAGAQLGINNEGWEQTAGADQERAEFRMLTALSWIQEELVAALEA